LEYLLRLGKELRRPAILFPTSDFGVLLIARNEDALRDYFRFPQPGAAVIECIMNKAELARRAMECNVPVPATHLCRGAADVCEAGAAVGYPCVIKPVYSFLWHQGDAWNLVGKNKAIKVCSPEELESGYQRVSRVTQEVLVQEFIPGPDHQIFVAGLYVGQDGRQLASFTARKLLQYPPQMGTGCVVERVANEEVLSLAARLLQHLRYSGIAEVEFKWDAANGVYKLIEVNPRFWDWHLLSAANGMDLGYAAYLDLSGQALEPVVANHAGTWWIADEGLWSYLRHRLRHGTDRRDIEAPHLGRLLLRRNIWGIFAWSDPLPFLGFAADQARDVARFLGKRLLARH
jgi:predicted ATP-grasp superfamily ATP-dependent carboligase